MLDVAEGYLSDRPVGGLGHEGQVQHPDDAPLGEIEYQLEAFAGHTPGRELDRQKTDRPEHLLLVIHAVPSSNRDTAHHRMAPLYCRHHGGIHHRRRFDS